MKTSRIDHLVLTVADIERSVSFYRDVLGMRRIEFGDGRIALGFGRQKINRHRHRGEFEPKAARVQPGSANLRFIVDDPLERALAELGRHGVDLIEGPVERSGAPGKIMSLYFRDPDGNLIEIANYPDRGGEKR